MLESDTKLGEVLAQDCVKSEHMCQFYGAVCTLIVDWRRA